MATGYDPRQATMWVRHHSPAGRWILLVTVLGSGLVALDATAVNVALPAIGQDFGASLAGLQWVMNAYTLTLAGLLLFGGSLGDRYGRRRLFVVGVVWFAVASLVCAIAPNAPSLIVARGFRESQPRCSRREPRDHRDRVPPGGSLGGNRRLVGPRWGDDRDRTRSRRIPDDGIELAAYLPHQSALRSVGGMGRHAASTREPR